MHAYLLLSDSRISDSNHNHYSWSADHTADSTDYDNAFWADVNSAICYANGAWYYSKFQLEGDLTKAVKLVKKDGAGLLAGSEDVVFEAPAWPYGTDGYYPLSYMYLAKANNKVYFNTSTEIYQMNTDGTVEQFHSPEDLSDMQIYGFTVRGNEFWYAPGSSPHLTGKQTIHNYILPEISGITAEDIREDYTGQPYTITVNGLQSGDAVQYALAGGGGYQSAQPEMVDAGTYKVRYLVERDGYAAFCGEVTVIIAQAVPQYELPTGLCGYIGDTLSSVELPEGFSWQTDAGTKLEGTGTGKYLVQYTPADSRNYQTVSDIEVEVEKECHGHRYISEITTPPTAEQNGIETYTCTLCGDTYTKEIDKDLPVLTDITATDVTGAYTGQPYLVTVSGILEGDAVQFALQNEGFGQEQPEMINAGTYEVLYKVTRAGYQPFSGSVRVEITKAVPTYTVPTGCAGSSGDRLADIALPDGFAWQQPDTVLREEGTRTYQAAYTPEDTENYQTVSVDVAVEVTCPGHEYTSEITKEPTETEEGIRTYTCSLCGDSYTEEMEKLSAVITGIAAEDVAGIYTGRPYTITVQGTKAGDAIEYALKSSANTGEVYKQEQPEMINAGTYEVLYKVTRAGYQPFSGSVRVEIARANPDYTVPANLKGVSGTALKSIELPEGFLWQTDPDTKLDKTGFQKFYVCYRPADQLNYQTIMDIEVEIEVACPGHQYDSVITKAATETEKGLKTYTCTLCGNVYTEEIDMLSPAKPLGVSGLKITKRTTNSLSFSWKEVSGVSYRLMFYKGDRLVSTEFVTGSAHTYNKLKPAAIYTLQVTPYRMVNGQKIFADAPGGLKTATSPAKANLRKAKRIGNSRVKLTWKKVSGAGGYEIFMKTGKGGYKKIKTVGNGKTISFTKKKLSKKKTYSFRVRAYTIVDGTKIYGAYSNVKKVK